MQVIREGYENLVTLLAVAAFLAMVGLAAKLVEQNNSPIADKSKQVKGYVRPASSFKAKTPSDVLNEQAHKKPEVALKDMQKIKERFDQAIALLHAKQYEFAIKALDAILKMQNNIPEVYVNMGYAYLGIEDYVSSRSAFEKAIDLKVGQVNAYYGLAIALEGQKELEGALGAMRSYIHLSDPKDKHLAKARAALWEWEAELGRVKGVTIAPESQQNAAANPDANQTATAATNKPRTH